MTIAELVADHATADPDGVAFASEGERLTWAGYDSWSDQLAGHLVAEGFRPGDRVAVQMADGPAVHAAFVACEKAGLVVVGIGGRAGAREVDHLMTRTGARHLVTEVRRSCGDPEGLAFASEGERLSWKDYDRWSDDLAGHLVAEGFRPGDRIAVQMADGPGVHAAFVACERAGLVVVGIGGPRRCPRGRPPHDPHRPRHLITQVDGLAPAEAPARERWLTADDVFLLNSTSGTTGLPKVVVHDQQRWFAFHELAVDAGELTADDVFMSLVPAPFGFGIWTSHVTPTALGAPCVVMSRFDADDRHRAHRGAPGDRARRGVDPVPDAARVAGVPRARPSPRCGSCSPAGRPSPSAGPPSSRTARAPSCSSSTVRTRPARSAARPPGTIASTGCARRGGSSSRWTCGCSATASRGARARCLSRGYLDDPAANAELYTPDGWMLTGDIVRIDDDGYLTVVGRASDFIIRGGKNVSAAQVEHEVGQPPRRRPGRRGRGPRRALR